MQQWIHDQNIKLFRAALAVALPPEKRTTIEALLAEEQAAAEPTSSASPAHDASVITPARQHAIREGFPQTRVPGEAKY